MAGRAASYPQVEPGAGGLADAGVVRVPAEAGVEEALARAPAARVAVVAVGGGAWVLVADLARAAALGLGTLPAVALARRLPVVADRLPEVAVRRLLRDGAPAVVVRGPHGSLRAVRPGAACAGAPGPSLAGRVARLVPPRLRAVVAAVATVASEQRVAAYLVGGVVRELVRGVPPAGHDLDVAVEGPGAGVARGLARRLGGEVVEHARFLTATVRAPGVRVDVATARDERYAAPGALPTVAPAPMCRDLGRRDFTINAMALELASGALALLDPHGGRGDAARSRLRVLHPLSFVEDPTRLFRAARYAARLGCAIEAGTRTAARLALALAPYRALSGERLRAELARIATEDEASAALRHAGRIGALRLLDPGHRMTAGTCRGVAHLGAALAWARRQGLRVQPLELALVALLADQPVRVRVGALGRLAIRGEPARRVLGACVSDPASVTGAGGDDLSVARGWLGASAAERRRLDGWRLGLRGSRPALRGDELIGLGVPAGPAVGRALAALRLARAEGRVRDRRGEIRHARAWIDRERTRREEG